MTGAAYVVEGGTARATAHAAGPWHPGLQHGGAPASLVVWAAERVPTAAPMRVARLTVELLRPVPVAPLELRVATLREGRKIQLVEIRLLHDGKEVVRGTVLKLRTAETPLPRGPILPPLDAPPPAGVSRRPRLQLRLRRRLRAPPPHERGRLGPAKVWFRQHAPIVEGEPLSPAMRAAAVGDYSNGIATELPWNDWTFINADLTVSLAREPEGEWILSDAECWVGEDGTGLAMCRLADERGTFGRAVQSLVAGAAVTAEAVMLPSNFTGRGGIFPGVRHVPGTGAPRTTDAAPSRSRPDHRRASGAGAGHDAFAVAAEDGWSVEWPACGIDLGSAQLRRWADEQAGEAMPAEAFRAWVEGHGLTLDRAAEALGLSRRTVAYYLSGEQPVPKTVMLATEGYDKRQAA